MILTILYRSRSGCRANPCVEGVCGRGAECEDVGGRPVCKCLPGHHVNIFTANLDQLLTGCCRGTPTPAASRASATRTRTAGPSAPARTTSAGYRWCRYYLT